MQTDTPQNGGEVSAWLPIRAYRKLPCGWKSRNWNIPPFPLPRISGILKRSHGEHPLKLRFWHWLVLAVCVTVSVGLSYRNLRVAQGEHAFARLGCPACHLAGGAPSLAHVGSKYDRAALAEFIGNPETVYACRGHRSLNVGYLPMPRLAASGRDVVALSFYLSAQR